MGWRVAYLVLAVPIALALPWFCSSSAKDRACLSAAKLPNKANGAVAGTWGRHRSATRAGAYVGQPRTDTGRLLHADEM